MSDIYDAYLDWANGEKKASDPQRWVWTEHGMEPYRPHPLMPDVGGVFVRAEEVADLENETGLSEGHIYVQRYRCTPGACAPSESGEWMRYDEYAALAERLQASEATIAKLRARRANLLDYLSEAQDANARLTTALDHIQADATVLPIGCPDPWRTWILDTVRLVTAALTEPPDV